MAAKRPAVVAVALLHGPPGPRSLHQPAPTVAAAALPRLPTPAAAAVRERGPPIAGRRGGGRGQPTGIGLRRRPNRPAGREQPLVAQPTLPAAPAGGRVPGVAAALAPPPRPRGRKGVARAAPANRLAPPPPAGPRPVEAGLPALLKRASARSRADARSETFSLPTPVAQPRAVGPLLQEACAVGPAPGDATAPQQQAGAHQADQGRQLVDRARVAAPLQGLVPGASPHAAAGAKLPVAPAVWPPRAAARPRAGT